MSEKVLGALHVFKQSWNFAKKTHEELILTTDRILVMNRWIEYFDASHMSIRDYEYDYEQGGGLASWAIEKSAESRERMLEKGRQAKTLEELLNADERNFAIPYSEITKVELKKGWIRVKLNIITSKKKHKWNVHAIIPEKSPNFRWHKKWELEDYENMLRPIFGDRLSVKK